jgi:hypothetical protein
MRTIDERGVNLGESVSRQGLTGRDPSSRCEDPVS